MWKCNFGVPIFSEVTKRSYSYRPASIFRVVKCATIDFLGHTDKDRLLQSRGQFIHWKLFSAKIVSIVQRIVSDPVGFRMFLRVFASSEEGFVDFRRAWIFLHWTWLLRFRASFFPCVWVRLSFASLRRRIHRVSTIHSFLLLPPKTLLVPFSFQFYAELLNFLFGSVQDNHVIQTPRLATLKLLILVNIIPISKKTAVPYDKLPIQLPSMIFRITHSHRTTLRKI